MSFPLPKSALKILVTGGAGFLGSHLVTHLLDEGHYVTVLDSLQTGSTEHVQERRKHSKFTFIHHDIAKPVPESIEDIDQIYHLACPASPVRFVQYPVSILDTCYLGTKNVLEFARQNKARVLLSSTSEVYGDAQLCPQSETYFGNVNCFGPRSCYDEGKRVAEALAYSYQLEHGVDIRVCRVFNTYGPGMRPDDGRVMPEFITSAVRGNKLKVTGDGKSSRCFLYVDDCVAGMVKLMNSSYRSPVNIGCETETTVTELANIIRSKVAEKLGHSQAKVEYAAKRRDDPIRRKPDISLATRELSWSPIIDLSTGLNRTIDWFASEPGRAQNRDSANTFV